MIDIPTLFILGAGASKPYGFPLGPELRKEIITNYLPNIQKLVDPSSKMKREKVTLLSDATKFIENFSKSPIDSIDKYLSLNPIFSYHGKMAITLCILEKEKTSKFLEDMETPDAKEDWCKLIFYHMTSALKEPGDYKKFRDNNVAFITFNYDHSLEYFLYESFCRTFCQSIRDFESSLTDWVPFPVVHVYGQVGKLSFEHYYEGMRFNYRDDDKSFAEIQDLSNGIRIIGDRSSEILDNVKPLIESNKRVFFLGFGYAKENLDAIGLPDSINDDWKIIGTAKGMTEKEIKSVRYLLATSYKMRALVDTYINPRIEDKNCYELLREFL